ncbi:hypothetical protein AUJ77_00305 [Candidatus Nomurabacteria bacterium CG1_02_43_90]|uniref:Methyltransferase FkbM domain-containing protein n=1 Tax=Candidatus Nomurabacteria bacterium CG1_02_43_90 TaxID=1805281 RepID=A0A1J4V9L3_9BACT|nr:MAG: hypothetical protein AUJ77_00305 [Candidatus Nomurabacteria bacterium CG1_02_43_90]
MKTTSKIKFIIKRNLPDFLFTFIKAIYNATIAKSISVVFTLRAYNFKKETLINLNYFGFSYKLYINPKNGYLDKWLYVYKCYETHILKEIMNNIKKGDTVLDIGANIGHHSLFISKVVGDKGNVISFEPISFLREQFEKSTSINKSANVTVMPLALGEKESKETIHICESNTAGSSIVNFSAVGKKESIKVVTLDSLSLNPSFMKIDVEGYEYFVLKGAEETIKKNHPKILLEYSPLYYAKTNPSHQKEIITFLRNNNYDIYDLDEERKKIVDDVDFISSFNQGFKAQTNILCVQK